MSNEFKKAVSNKYRLLEIDIDNVFERILLHSQNNYAAMSMVEINGLPEKRVEVKGLDMRRREYCNISKDAST